VPNDVKPALRSESITGSDLRQLRMKAGITQLELASRTGISQSVISAWENGVGAPPAEETIALLRSLAAKAESANNIVNVVISDSIRRIGNADPKDVQQIAASQLELMAGYHQIALAQSRRSFFGL
jgi:transcriptional regulator with XRE-family HTH domain